MVAPQNTLPAFRKSFEIGCDGVETDIHLTKDGVPVLCHNFTIDETSTGKGAIKDMTYEELLQFDFGSYKGEEFKDVIKMGRTQLQDAVPMTLGQEFTAYAATLAEEIDRLEEVVDDQIWTLPKYREILFIK